ncbi:MAG: DUF4863 family protein [Beijerinckiaceae bacterium]
MEVRAPDAAQRDFAERIAAVVESIGDRPLDSALAQWLNANYPADGAAFKKLAALLEAGCAEGWLCQREADGIRFGRVIKPGQSAGAFSVDVVRMDRVAGPHHVHPKGEIGMIVPLAGEPRFDGFAAGWYVYGPGSAHRPTVTGGSAYVLYLLPEGSIEFTRS